MRRWGLWESPMVDRNRWYIVDTAELRDSVRFARAVVPAPEAMPADTVLVVMHPQQARKLRAICAFIDGHASDSIMAFLAIDARCAADPTLKARLRWV